MEICVYGETSANLLLSIPSQTASPAKIIRAVCRHLDNPAFAQMELLDCNGRKLHPTTIVEAGATLHMQSRKGPLDRVFSEQDEACAMIVWNDTLPLRVPYMPGTDKAKIMAYCKRVFNSQDMFALHEQNPSRCGGLGIYHYTAVCAQPPEAFPHDETKASTIDVYFKDIDKTVTIPFAMARADYAIQMAQEIGQVPGKYESEGKPDELYTCGTTLVASSIADTHP